MTLETDIQKLQPDTGIIELYTLDLTRLGGTTYRFTPYTGATISLVGFGGFIYNSMPIKADGFDQKGDGSQPRPTLTISNVGGLLNGVVITLGDLVGGKVTRLRTLTKFLDGQPTADSTQYFPPDIYIISQKKGHNKQFITWELCTVIDRLDVKLPRRQITKQGDTRYGGFPGVGSYKAAGL